MTDSLAGRDLTAELDALKRELAETKRRVSELEEQLDGANPATCDASLIDSRE